jgi:hypothetical protein
MSTISLADVIDEMDSGRQFDIEYVTADRKRGIGGELKAYSGVIKTHAVVTKVKSNIRHCEERATKHPNHSFNSTVNIYAPREPDSKKRIKKVHLRLITRFNGKDVL